METISVYNLINKSTQELHELLLRLVEVDMVEASPEEIGVVASNITTVSDAIAGRVQDGEEL